MPPTGIAASQWGGQWQCAAISEINTFQIARGPLVVNNLSLHEDMGIISRRPYVEFSYSAVNRSNDSIFVSVQLVGLSADDSGPVIAVSAQPALGGSVSSNRTEQVSTTVNTNPGEFDALKGFCVRVDGSF